MSKQISQAEARRLKRRVRQLEEEREAMLNSFRDPRSPMVHLITWTLDKEQWGIFNTARKFGAAFVAKIENYGASKQVRIFGVVK